MYHHGSAAYYIDDQGLDHPIPVEIVDRYIAEGHYTVKVEGLEGMYDISQITSKPHTVHMYVSPGGAISFPKHTDPYPVFIHVLEGVKVMEVDGEIKTIHQGDTLEIPANTPHRALNEYDSVMLSIGYDVT